MRAFTPTGAATLSPRTAEGAENRTPAPIEADWIACLPNAHPKLHHVGPISGRICASWESNGRGYGDSRAVRPRGEGSPALLQGRAVCGVCGQYFRVQYKYKAPRGRLSHGTFVIVRSSKQGAPNCQSVSRPPRRRSGREVGRGKDDPRGRRVGAGHSERRSKLGVSGGRPTAMSCTGSRRLRVEADLAQRAGL